MVKYFGLSFSAVEPFDAKRVAANMFLSYNIKPQQVEALIDRVRSGEISEESFNLVADKYIRVLEDLAEYDLELPKSMHKRLEEWSEHFGAPTEDDINYIRFHYTMHVEDLFGEEYAKADRDCAVAEEPAGEQCAESKVESAKQLADVVKQYIKGQDEAIERLAVPFFQHLDSARKGYTCRIKSSVMMMGPTGTGKSEMLRVMAQVCDCPVVFVNSSEVRPSGWKGLHISDMIAKELNNGVSEERMKYAIIVLDEVDKITKYGRRMVSDNGTDESVDMMRDIMKLLDVGHTLHLENGVNVIDGTPRIVELPTENFLLVFSGAFCGMDDIIKRRLNIGTTIGFGKQMQGEDEEVNYMSKVTVEDLVEWGYMPELLGRIGEIVVMNPLTTDVILDIMKSAKGNIVESHVDYAHRNHVDLRFSDDALRAIAEEAHRSGLGFRNVKALLSKALNPLYFTLGGGEGDGQPRVVNIDSDYINKGIRSSI